ncbi:MerR family transcriptional regulator [Natronincola ferrireducens]|nr:MerR family transcriptional regulator [Natronincola ferrireducens]
MKMRIGEFAKKHGITQDTIRYYLDIGLLVTEKKGGQYKFTKADSEDIKKIIELKSIDFSLNEIQSILIFQRLSGTNTDVFRNLYLPFLESKRNEITNELAKYNRMNDYLNSKINEIKSAELRAKQRLGLPMAALSILVCPICKASFKISDGSIEESMIIDANINCSCGYNAIIQEGVYIDRSAPRTKMINGKKMPTKEEFLSECSYTFVNFLYKGMATIIEYINKYKEEPKYIMELDNCVGFFLLQYIKDLPPTSTYIVIDYDKERILKLKNNLEMYYDHKNFIFLCCDFHKLPITQSSMDIVVDFGMSKTYLESEGKFLLDMILPLLKEKGIISGAYQYIGQNEKAKENIQLKNEDLFSRSKILKILDSLDITILDLIDIGPVLKDLQHKGPMKSTEVYKLAYVGRKTKK